MKILPSKNLSFYVLFVFWPFGAFYNAIKQYSSKESRIVVYLFLSLFGFSFVLGNELMDSFSYAEKFRDTARLPFNQFFNIVSGLYDTETSLDIMMPLLNFIFSRFTDDHRMLFGVWAMIFGYFHLKSVNIQHNKYVISRNKNILFLITLFVIMNPITNINGFRFWTAAWIFFYSAYSVIVFKNKSYLFLSLSSILFHFSFIAPNIVLISFLFLGNKNIIYTVLLIISFIFSELSFSIIPDLAGYLGEGFSDRTLRYTSELTLEQLQYRKSDAISSGAWYLFLPKMTLTYYIYFAILMLRRRQKLEFKNDLTLNSLFSFTLFFLSFVNFTSPIPSMSRFRIIFNLFAIAYMIAYFAKHKSYSFNWITYIGIIPLILNLIFVVRMTMDVLNPWLFAPNPLPFLFNETSFYQFLFGK